MKTPVTQLLRDCKSGDQDARDKLWQLISSELKRLARYRMKAEQAGHTLQATMLADDVFHALVGKSEISFNDRAHFFAIASSHMRRSLIDYARRRKAEKRGGGAFGEELDEAALYVSVEPRIELIALDEALTKLEMVDPTNGKIVELFYFTGLTHDEIAGQFDISVSAVEKRLSKAKAWLFNELTKK